MAGLLLDLFGVGVAQYGVIAAIVWGEMAIFAAGNPMNTLTFYIVKEVLKGVLVALAVLLALFNLFTLSDELRALSHDYDIKAIFLYIALVSPRVIYELIPFAALLGSLFVIGAMATRGEIVAMHAAGLSVGWLLRSVLIAGVILLVLAVFVGEVVAPKTEQQAQALKASSKHQAIMRHSHNIWLREGNKFINVRRIAAKNRLQDIYIYTAKDQQLQSIAKADSAAFQGDNIWQLQGLQQTLLSGENIKINSQQKRDWHTSINPDLLETTLVKTDNLSLHDMFVYINFLRQNKQKSQKYELAFWSRLINPLLALVMLVVAIPIVVHASRTSKTASRIFIGVIIGISFNILDKIIGNFGIAYDLNPAIVAITPSLLVLTAASVAIAKMR